MWSPAYGCGVTTIISGGRGAGKTYRLVQWALQDEKRVIVVSTQDRANRLVNQYPGLARPYMEGARAAQHTKVWTVLQLEHMTSSGKKAVLAFDDAEQLLRHACAQMSRPLPVDIITLSPDETMYTTDNPHLPQIIRDQVRLNWERNSDINIDDLRTQLADQADEINRLKSALARAQRLEEQAMQLAATVLSK